MNMIVKNLHNYLQQSFIYDNFFSESINLKINKIQEINKKREYFKKDLAKNKYWDSDALLTNKTLGLMFLEFQKFKQEIDSMPIIINGAIMTSFQLLEVLFFNIYEHYTGKDYMRGCISDWLQHIEKDNKIFDGNESLDKIIGTDILNSILEYNKRRDLCTHSFGKITSKYIAFLNNNPGIKNKLEEISKLENRTGIQKYEVGEYLATGQIYYSINQMLLDLVACKVSIYISMLEKQDVHEFIEEITSLILTNKKYVLGASLLIGLQKISGLSLRIESEINLLFICMKINRGGFEKEKDDIYLICKCKLDIMNKVQLFKWYLMNNDIENAINNMPANGSDIIKLLNSPIISFYFKNISVIEKLRSSTVGNILKENINVDNNALTVEGLDNFKKIAQN